jgi:hypothetical protein
LCGAISFCRVLDFGSNEKLHGSYFLHSINFDFGVFAVVARRANGEKCRETLYTWWHLILYWVYTPNSRVNDNKSLRSDRFSCF